MCVCVCMCVYIYIYIYTHISHHYHHHHVMPSAWISLTLSRQPSLSSIASSRSSFHKWVHIMFYEFFNMRNSEFPKRY